MPEYLSPGVYIQEIDGGPRPIEGVGTACAAFVGCAPGGPVNTPVLVTNWTQYVTTFSGLDPAIPTNKKPSPHLTGFFLSHSVYGYFLNGGGRCYVVRVPNSANGNGASAARPVVEPTPATLELRSKGSTGTPGAPVLTVSARSTPTEPITINVDTPSGDPPASDGDFNLKIRMGTVEEVYERVTLSRARGARNVLETVNTASRLVQLLERQAAGSIAERMPATGEFVLQPPVLGAASGSASAPARVEPRDMIGDVSERSGIEGLQIAEDVTMVCCPDLMALHQQRIFDDAAVKSVQLQMIAHCENMGDRVAILDTPDGLSPQAVSKWRMKDTNYDSKYAALYYPWIKVPGPDGAPLAIPPSGHIAGIYARSDNERGVHKAPANEVIRGALESSMPITKGEQDTLNPIGVNCLRSFPGRGLRVWGARTLSSDPAWRYINVRRLFNYVEKSIERGTQWVVFEPNDPDLWARVKRDVEQFLTGVWREGALFGSAAGQAFFVKCDAELNPADVRDRGQLFIDIGMAPVKPAEFVVFRLSQWAGGGA
jgi:phage tail sheath protein FI